MSCWITCLSLHYPQQEIQPASLRLVGRPRVSVSSPRGLDGIHHLRSFEKDLIVPGTLSVSSGSGDRTRILPGAWSRTSARALPTPDRSALSAKKRRRSFSFCFTGWSQAHVVAKTLIAILQCSANLSAINPDGKTVMTYNFSSSS